MKTFALWLLIFVIVALTMSVALGATWNSGDWLIESTLLSYVLYSLIKEELKEK